MTTAIGDLQMLAEVSARIGSDHLLVQGPGGNSSVKIDDTLWVKASGYWLAQALQSNIFVPLSLSGVERRMAEGDYDGIDAEVLADQNVDNLRPSIETALHALMPHPFVIHAHAVNAMATSVLSDGEAVAGARLDGLRWRWICYRRPGEPLAREIREAQRDRPTDILILQNHGVVVGAESAQAAASLLEDVEMRLAVPVLSLASFDAARAEMLADDRFEVHEAASAIAFVPELLAILGRGPLTPDQVVFLGGGVPVAAEGERVADVESRIKARSGVDPVLVLMPGQGAVARRDRSPSAESLISGLIELARRIPAGASITELSDDDAATLLGWDAEVFRITLNTTRSAP